MELIDGRTAGGRQSRTATTRQTGTDGSDVRRERRVPLAARWLHLAASRTRRSRCLRPDDARGGFQGDTGPSNGPQHALPPSRRRVYFRSVASLGRQAAEALAYVHDLGIQHRDIKPANLLVDSDAHLWVTDFGLARLQGDGDHTRTGDLLGTLRYMSPEQALARPGLIDYRTDIYSLSATLYELLTLRPAFGGDDRQELLQRIIQDEPAPLRRLNPAIPIDLETIVTKAMAKEPSRRYTTAQELADDLARFLEGRPVLARKPSPMDGVAKWVRRHWPLVASAVASSLLILGVSFAGLSWSNTRLRMSNQQLEREVARADHLQRLAKERQRLAARHLYATRIRSAHQALEQGQIEWAQEFLDEIKPDDDGTDPRHFAWHYLRRLATREIHLFHGHEDPIDYVAISPDGGALVTRDVTHRVLLWDTRTGRARAELAGRNFATGCPRFSSDGRLVIATELAQPRDEASRQDRPRSIVVWDAASGRRLSRTELFPRAGYFVDLAYEPENISYWMGRLVFCGQIRITPSRPPSGS